MKNKLKNVNIEKILYIKSFGDYTNVFEKEGNNIVVKKLLNGWERILSDNIFIRVHRSFIININHLKKVINVTKYSFKAIMKNGEEIPVSFRYYVQIKEKLAPYME